MGNGRLPSGVIRHGPPCETVSEQPNAIRTIPGLGASPQEAPALIVGKTILRLKYQGPISAPLQGTASIVVEQRGVVQELSLPIVITPLRPLRASPGSLMFGADSLAKLRAIGRKTIITTESPGSGTLEIVRKPNYLDARLDPLGDAPDRVLLVATVTGDISAGSPSDEVVLRDATGSELVIPVYLDLHP